MSYRLAQRSRVWRRRRRGRACRAAARRRSGCGVPWDCFLSWWQARPGGAPGVADRVGSIRLGGQRSRTALAGLVLGGGAWGGGQLSGGPGRALAEGVAALAFVAGVGVAAGTAAAAMPDIAGMRAVRG